MPFFGGLQRSVSGIHFIITNCQKNFLKETWSIEIISKIVKIDNVVSLMSLSSLNQ